MRTLLVILMLGLNGCAYEDFGGGDAGWVSIAHPPPDSPPPDSPAYWSSLSTAVGGTLDAHHDRHFIARRHWGHT